MYLLEAVFCGILYIFPATSFALQSFQVMVMGLFPVLERTETTSQIPARLLSTKKQIIEVIRHFVIVICIVRYESFIMPEFW